jgi:hypothetical protein
VSLADRRGARRHRARGADRRRANRSGARGRRFQESIRAEQRALVAVAEPLAAEAATGRGARALEALDRHQPILRRHLQAAAHEILSRRAARRRGARGAGALDARAP